MSISRETRLGAIDIVIVIVIVSLLRTPIKWLFCPHVMNMLIKTGTYIGNTLN